MSDERLDRELMALALEQARASLAVGGVPVGAVLAAGGDVLGAGHNERVQHGDPVAHGEISALRDAGRRPSYAGTTLYTTLSPCQLCTGAVLLFQIPRVVVGEARTFEGDLGFLRSRGVDVVLLDDPGCVAAMEEFQTRYPEVWSEDIGGRLRGFRSPRFEVGAGASVARVVVMRSLPVPAAKLARCEQRSFRRGKQAVP